MNKQLSGLTPGGVCRERAHRDMRAPTETEVAELVETWRSALGLSEEEAWELRDNAHIGMVDSYITDGPGFAGMLAMIVWTGGPELMNTAIRRAPGVWQWIAP